MAAPLRAKITVRIFTDEKCFGPGVAELLHRVDEYHSLRAAAMSMEMAYSKAWTVVHNAENRLGIPILDVKIGGKNGGGATLTEDARRLLAAYERYCQRLNEYGEKLFEEEFGFYNPPQEKVEK